MSDKEFQKKKNLVTDIIQTLRAGDCYISGDLFFSLIFLDNKQLKSIAGELYMNVED